MSGRAWSRHLEEAALLPANHPRRRALEAELQSRPAAEQAYWAALLREAQHLRAGLERVPVPPGLEEALLQLPEEVPRRHHPLWTGAAALAVGAFLVWLLRAPPPARRVAELARAMHRARHELHVKLADPRAFERLLRQRSPLPVRLPPLPGWRLAGGCTCQWEGHPVVYSRWRRDGSELSLIQFRPADFELPPTGGPWRFPGAEPVRIWTEGGRGYVAVGLAGGEP